MAQKAIRTSVFSWEGTDRKGSKVKGELSGASPALVKAQLRLGRETVGPNIPPNGADVVIAMEVSEALRAVRMLRPGGEFLLFGERWLPTAVLLGKAPYPATEAVLERVAPGLVWLAVVFSLFVMVQRSYAVEMADGALDALRVAGDGLVSASF